MIIQWALVLTICTTPAPGTPDSCDDWVRDMQPTYLECVKQLPRYAAEHGLVAAACEVAIPAPEGAPPAQ